MGTYPATTRVGGVMVYDRTVLEPNNQPLGDEPVTDRDASTIQVIGDVTVDWAILAPSASSTALDSSYRWEQPAAVHMSPLAGSAAFISDLLHAAVREHDARVQPRISGPSLPREAFSNPAEPSVARSFAIWEQYPQRLGKPQPVWRMRQFLGLQLASSAPIDQQAVEASADCLVIDDANLGFRDDPSRWDALNLVADRPQHVIVKLSTPLAVGPLWDHLIGGFADRLTVYCSVGDLRKEYAPIGQPLSWERTGSDVVDAIRRHSTLTRARLIVVSLGQCGAVMIEPGESNWLVFDPLHQEGDWEHVCPGSTPGLGTAITASLALAAARDPESPDWECAVAHGLAAGRQLHVRGFTPSPDRLLFPDDAVRMLSGDDQTGFQTCEIPTDPEWQIASAAFQGNERSAAERIVVEGDEVACPNLPVERMGVWSSIDRTEIESMRSVRHIMREYLQQERPHRPLSLAVFGPPGSGKSFAIKQMAREWIASGFPIDVLEFNLSQFATGELPRALQRVRDCAVERRLPLVFWDEFDTSVDGRELGWLAQFLAPMQDGMFLEEGIARPIGPAIFIFAGGTHAAMASFKDRSVDRPAAKATDFLSRLRGFVDILGPNPSGDQDRSFVLRRALLLRSFLKAKAPQLLAHNVLQIDPGVLRAFLDVTSYVHGARSMEAILDMSALSGKLRYERSALPPAHQLGLHVEPEEFLTLVHDE